MKLFIGFLLLTVSLAAPQGGQGGRKPQSQLQQLEEEVVELPRPYQFGLEVSDDETTNYQTRHESQDEFGVVTGQYSWVAPNSIRYITSYRADPENGFQANTKEEQTNIVVIIPEPKPEFQNVRLLRL